MLLVIDAGNTNITLGVFRGEKLYGTFRLTTKIKRTSDEYGITLKEMVERQGLPSDEIDSVIIASVVPDIMHSLGSAIIKYFHVTPLVVSAGIKTGIRIVTENPRQVGADRIVDAVAAYTLHGGPVIVIDYGTATTYDLVGPDGTFESAVIAPGIRTSAQAMWGQAALLPAIEIKKPESILAKETISSMQAGLVYGQIGQTEYIVSRIKKESGYQQAKVVASGGLGRIIAAETDCIDIYDAELTLKGLRILYEKNKGLRKNR
ncbi:type III pantothenate kinase [Suipraeoptans intestinalis]|uniref:Type III pantothenate kinase n=1 Tax=Suipraeoptans intestinalis TaxID=2606628 RepID=A0A6N7V0R6_9FIRM|nr:type III pantothenate kinase [Suipraeoptans intestinalis]MDD7770850.1 type III pantothenate kinase [Suipraeoptans intestinalis]MDY3122484.1 type III pantothenate kinase [Suipraeoptans intestinalis]MSR93730.1 type III pantothenate kinase [Suipraeoptans intestinalis]